MKHTARNMNKRRWAALVTIAVILVFTGFLVQAKLAKKAERKRYVDYERATKSYSDALKPGVTRREVEQFLSRNHQFRQMCCVGVHRNAYADLVKIGKEKPPWYCSEKNIYVAFEFEANGLRSQTEARADDKLLTVTLYPWLEGCL